MKALIAAAAFVSVSAVAADVESVIAVSCDGEPVARISTVFAGLTPGAEAKLRKRADAVLSFASERQDKKGPCSATWQWGTQPVIETPGMTRQGAVQVAHRVAQFAREAADQALGGKKGRHWGD